MGISLQWDVILAFGFGLLLLYVCGALLAAPAKLLVKALWSALLGGIILVALHVFTSGLPFSIPVNVVTAAITGFLGLPGVILLFFTVWMLR